MFPECDQVMGLISQKVDFIGSRKGMNKLTRIIWIDNLVGR